VAKPRTPKGRARRAVECLAELYPGTAKELCALDFRNPYELLTATILSAQTTDVRVNMVTPALFAAYPDPAALAAANPEQVEEIIRTTGFFRSKTKSIMGMAAALEERFGGEVPTALEDLVTIPGVGRKTGNVVRSVAFGLPGLPVDTHVLRLSRRLGLTDGMTAAEQADAVKVELRLNSLVPASERGAFSLRLILHGRAVCVARKPRCNLCSMAYFCPTAQ
jgi:endonuclease III